MTIEEAKRFFEHQLEVVESGRTNVACMIALHAIELQIPKKVVKVVMRKTEWGSPYRCPCCEAELAPVEFFVFDGKQEMNRMNSWCPDCGQKLDWGEVDG